MIGSSCTEKVQGSEQYVQLLVHFPTKQAFRCPCDYVFPDCLRVHDIFMIKQRDPTKTINPNPEGTAAPRQRRGPPFDEWLECVSASDARVPLPQPAEGEPGLRAGALQKVLFLAMQYCLNAETDDLYVVYERVHEQKEWSCSLDIDAIETLLEFTDGVSRNTVRHILVDGHGDELDVHVGNTLYKYTDLLVKKPLPEKVNNSSQPPKHMQSFRGIWQCVQPCFQWNRRSRSACTSCKTKKPPAQKSFRKKIKHKVKFRKIVI